MIDLTPFGFTPTESAAYRALLELGPSSGYGVAKHLSIARANAYQALDALASKGAATASTEAPRSYRAVAPEGVLALVTQQQAANLDRLEAELATVAQLGEPTTVRFSGERRLDEIVLRTAARADTVRCVGSESILRRLVPIWRKREQDGALTALKPIEGPGVHFILITPSAAIAAVQSDELQGFWSSDPVVVGLASAALKALS